METGNDALVPLLLAAARFQAMQAGLSGADAEDCALLFAQEHFADVLPAGTRCQGHSVI